jgi:hypothetical protein
VGVRLSRRFGSPEVLVASIIRGTMPAVTFDGKNPFTWDFAAVKVVEVR